MKTLFQMRLSTKLPLYFVCFCLLVAVTLATSSFLNFRKALVHEAETTFTTIAENRKEALETWLESIDADIRSMAASYEVSHALAQFQSAWIEFGPEPKNDLQDAYITANPNPTGQKHLLNTAPGDQRYHQLHGRYHPSFVVFQQLKGYYDLFLFDMDGDLVYSVFKEADYATNLVAGPYAASGLGRVFRSAANGQIGQVYYDDFAPYAPSNDAPAAFVSTPIADATGKIIGVLAYQMPIDRLFNIVNNPNGLGDTGEIVLVGSDLKARSQSRHAGRYDLLDDLAPRPQIEAGLRNDARIWNNVTGVSGEPVLAFSTGIKTLGVSWALIAEISMAEVLAPVAGMRQVMIVLSLGATAVLSLLGWLIARSITRPIARVSAAMDRVSQGDFDTEINEATRRDEIGEMAKVLVRFKQKLADANLAEADRQAMQDEQRKVVQSLSVGLVNLSNGNLTQPISDDFHEDYRQLRDDYNTAINTLSTVLGEVVETATKFKRGANEIALSSDNLCTRTESTAATLEESAAALDQLTHGVASAADGAKSALEFVGHARDHAEKSGDVVRRAVTAMAEIKTSSGQISQFVGVIEEISFQTNLLALNAGVEAARAGDFGKGFAVVATEVRALAQRSSSAAKEIKALIESSSNEVQKGVELVGDVGVALNSIIERVGHITTLVSEISTGMSEQSVGISEINTGVIHLDQVTQQNASMVEEATAAAQHLKTDAATLVDFVSRFQIRKTMASNIVSFDQSEDSFDASVVESFEAIPVPAAVQAGSRGVKTSTWNGF